MGGDKIDRCKMRYLQIYELHKVTGWKVILSWRSLGTDTFYSVGGGGGGGVGGGWEVCVRVV